MRQNNWSIGVAPQVRGQHRRRARLPHRDVVAALVRRHDIAQHRGEQPRIPLRDPPRIDRGGNQPRGIRKADGGGRLVQALPHHPRLAGKGLQRPAGIAGGIEVELLCGPVAIARLPGQAEQPRGIQYRLDIGGAAIEDPGAVRLAARRWLRGGPLPRHRQPAARVDHVVRPARDPVRAVAIARDPAVGACAHAAQPLLRGRIGRDALACGRPILHRAA